MDTDVILPGGLVLEDGSTWTHAKLRGLAGAEEDWLATTQGVPSAAKVSKILSSCVTALDGKRVTPESIGRLLVGDREYLMLQLRRLTLGDNLDAVLQCPGCGSPMDVSVKLGELPVPPRPQTSAWYSVANIRFRLPTGADQEAVLGLEPAVAEEVLLKRCLAREQHTELNSAEREAVISEMERLAPSLDLELDLTCPECAYEFVAPFDTTAFFFEEMRAKSGQLLREIHILAFYYHWSESEILTLGRRRRHAYLNLLSESLRQE